jgi:hypothetical protein
MMEPTVTDQERFAQRELVVRVATLELLVADLIHLARQLDPAGVEQLVREAAVDLEAQTARAMPSDAEKQRFRLRQVFDSRARSLARRRFSSRCAVQHHAATD